MSDEQLNADQASNGPARKLADILREAGVSSTGAGGRRRRRDETPDPVEEFGTVESAGSFDSTEFGAEFGSGESSDPAVSNGDFRRSELSSSEFSSGEFRALSAYLFAPEIRPSEPPQAIAPQAIAPQVMPPPVVPSPAVPPPIGTRPPGQDPAPGKVAAKAPPAEVAPWTDTGPVTPFGWAARGGSGPQGPGAEINSSSAFPSGSSPRSADTEAPASMLKSRVSARALQAAATVTSGPSHANRSASPLASSLPEDPEEAESALPLRGGAASWAILAVELVAALGLGVAAWYAFSALWELLPYVAAFAGPLVITGLVAVAGALRARTGRNPLGLPTLCILVFAGTVLVVLPAATVIIP